MEQLQAWESTALNHNGGRSSLMMVHSSPIGKTRRYLMFQVERMLKDKLLLSTRNMVQPTRDGRLSILTLIRDHRPRDLTNSSACTATDHSI
jgi:hypothetical protein